MSEPTFPEPVGPAKKRLTTRAKVLIVILVVAVVGAVGGVLISQAVYAQSHHGCPAGYYWGYGGNPTGMTPEQIEAASSCLQEGVSYKPIVYLYPSVPTDVTVTLSHPESLTVSYPRYDAGWTVHARPDGTLTDPAGRELYALYYESRNQVPTTATDGFVVRGADSAAFLEDTLARLGLTPREREEFIVYWLPILEASPWNLIHFMTPAEIDANQVLTVTPAPDTVIRVMMAYAPLAAPLEVTPQVLPTTPVRDGFVVVEWGGTPVRA